MTRRQLLLQAFQRGHLLTLENQLYHSFLVNFLFTLIRGDLGYKGDITSHYILQQSRDVKAVIKAKEPGIVAGIEEACFLYRQNNVMTKRWKNDGEKVQKGAVILELRGKEKAILMLERVGLNILQRMSGIATETFAMQEKSKVPIAATRKTLWGYLDKKAVFLGKGLTHRLNASESILIKNNHLEALKAERVKDAIAVALERAWSIRDKVQFIEIEVAKEEEALQAARKFKELNRAEEKPCFIMFDNFTPEQIKKALQKIRKEKLEKYCLFEASGGITPENVTAFSKTGVDVLSAGYLTHSARVLDIHQNIIR